MNFGFFPGFDLAFGIFGLFFAASFAFVFGLILFILIKGLSQWNKNNHAPRLTVPATVIAKRGHTSGYHQAGTMHHHHSTTYYVTFQVESGDRMELVVPGTEYGLLIEGDLGNLTFQGTRFLGFART